MFMYTIMQYKYIKIIKKLLYCSPKMIILLVQHLCTYHKYSHTLTSAILQESEVEFTIMERL